ncbi:hypothetical protein ACIRRA_42720 [Nocardia sp. NPDC101769]|uniref:hypothetical protein n=1 Tax=Nocardia sp. NPDC101769 TaxID=3364333 RepID=UPI0037FD41C3
MTTTDAVTFWDVYADQPAPADPRPNVLLAETVPDGRTAEVTDHVLLIRRTV